MTRTAQHPKRQIARAANSGQTDAVTPPRARTREAQARAAGSGQTHTATSPRTQHPMGLNTGAAGSRGCHVGTSRTVRQRKRRSTQEGGSRDE